jgi:hypothetical protein
VPNETNPNEPTLTCSEVVERLAMSAREFRQKHYVLPASLDTYLKAEEFAEAYAAAILHSWRERRVQELEEAIRAALPFVESAKRNAEAGSFNAHEMAEKALANSEWREQIRKGTKDEG